MNVYFPLIFAVVGMLIYAVSIESKMSEIGRILFWVGMLAFLLRYPEAVKLLGR